MRKFVYSFVVIALLLCLTACSSKQDFSANSFIDEFQLDLADENLLVEKMFDSYEGMPSSGVALYRIGFGGAECKEIYVFMISRTM